MVLNKKLNKKLLALAIIISIFIIIPSSFANENINVTQSQEISIDNDYTDILSDSTNIIYVNASYESSEGTGSSDSPAKTISQGLNLSQEGGTIYLTGRFTGDGNLNLTLDGNPNKITFIGVGNTIIDGNYLNSFAIVNKGTYTFKNIIFANNYKTGDDYQLGGVFYNIEGDLTFTDCLFENNTVYGVNRGNGGAIDNSGTLTVKNCIFKNNTANVSNSSGFRKNAADGGAISNLGKIYIYDTVFKENTALRNGGAIRTQDHATAYIENCEFDGNLAAYHESGGSFGGALYAWDCSIDVENTVFKNNKVIDISGYGAQGGAISYDRSSGTMTIKSCEFINNTATGVGLVSGQSMFIGGSANINYCTIDTSIYSASQDVNLNYNWWVVNDTKIKNLIEMLPSSAKIKTFAELKISFEGDEISNGDEIPIFVKLYWNGTENQNNINLIPTRTVYLTSNCGDLEEESGKLVNGIFETALYLNSIKNPTVIANIDNVIVTLDLSKKEEDNSTKISATCREISEGEDAIIYISSNNNISGICLIDIGNYKHYAEFVNGNTNATIPNLKAGKYIALIKYYNNESINTQTTITVGEKIDSKDTKITVNPGFTFLATDYMAGETGGYLTFTLTDTNGELLSNKTVQIAFNCTIYNVTTNESGIGKLQINLANSNVYTCAISFVGDESYNACPLTITKLTVNKKKTTISASSKTFKVKTKTKTVSVTLKTVKNTYDGKTYLYKGKKLTLTVNGKTYSAKTNAKGVAKFSLKLTKKGKYTAKIKFSGDATYKASNKSIKITIK